MLSSSSTKPGVSGAAYRFRCIGCGDLSDAAGQDFRCSKCEDLLEITYPSWKQNKPDAEGLKRVWRQRRLSPSAVDLSGVWRFRDLLPALESDDHAITLREGGTPLYELPRSARAVGLPRLLGKHQGLNPTGSFKDCGMTVAAINQKTRKSTGTITKFQSMF